MQWLIAGVVVLVWIVLPFMLLRRVSNATSLDFESSDQPSPAPHVSVVIPARNEEYNIEDCVRSMLTSSYPSFEVVVVDDNSSDSTGEIVQRIAERDSRVRVVRGDPLPDGWIGQPWALLTGARNTTGEIICFADADTRHGPGLLTRAVNMMLRREADFLSVSCRQIFGSFWERVVQPQVLLLLGARYGGSETITNATREEGKMAGGPCMFVRREAYESVGGHAVTKGYIASDVMLARGLFRHGKKVMMTNAGGHASVRMYNSLRELVAGWSKNIILGTRVSSAEPKARDLFKNILLLMIPLYQLLPLGSLIGGVVAGVPILLWSGVICSLVVTSLWMLVDRGLGIPRIYSLFFGAGAAVLAYILIKSLARGRSFSWKGRQYVSR
jgi:chlorobactene glucosyltransferase